MARSRRSQSSAARAATAKRSRARRSGRPAHGRRGQHRRPDRSGKTTLINDIELFADAQHATGRRVLINGERPPAEYRDDPARNPIALITQHTTFLSDLPVHEFLQYPRPHPPDSGRRRSSRDDRETLAFANQLTGEPIIGRAA